MKNLELAKKAKLEHLSPISTSRNFEFGSTKFKIKKNEFKYRCGVIVNIENKTVRNDWSISQKEAKRVISELIKLGYKY
jgi:hypothetical protein